MGAEGVIVSPVVDNVAGVATGNPLYDTVPPAPIVVAPLTTLHEISNNLVALAVNNPLLVA